jgi:uncharacterized protein (DUF58 family)
MATDPEVERMLEVYQLGLPRMPPAGRSGELLGRGVGTSIEFQEYRQYIPGDDIRHLDWAAYARSDTLMIRLYRNEISPRTEIILDGSRSMGDTSSAKNLVARQLTVLFAQMVARLGGRASVVVTGDEPVRPIPAEELRSTDRIRFQATMPLSEQLSRGFVPLKQQAVRIVLSDFLFPHDPAALIRRFAADASVLWVVQLLGAFEADPQPVGGKRLTDCESDATLDLVIDSPACARYRARLTALQASLAAECRRYHASFAIATAEPGLASLCRETLVPARMLRMA